MKAPKLSSILWSVPVTALLVLACSITSLTLMPDRGLAGPATGASAAPKTRRKNRMSSSTTTKQNGGMRTNSSRYSRKIIIPC